jgi:hypothetical protein
MPPLPPDFDWKSSRPHVTLLGCFVKPRDMAQVLGWQNVREGLKEKTKDALARFQHQGALIPATIEEALHCMSTASDLKESLKKIGQKTTGTKAELVTRLATSDPKEAQRCLGKAVVLKCSPEALQFVQEQQALAEQARERAFAQTHAALLAGDVREAWRVFAAYQREHANLYNEDGRWSVIRIDSIMAARPEALDGISDEEMRVLRAAVGMGQLWHTYDAEPWLPQTLASHAARPRDAANWVAAAASLGRDVRESHRTDRCGVIRFDEGDAESCALCRVLEGHEYALDALPRFPLAGCTSPVGCAIKLGDCASAEVEADDDDEPEDFDDDSEDALGALRTLKAMLDEELITQAEYEAKKREILGRL